MRSMRFTDFFIDHPTTTTLITAAIAGFGALCYFSLPVSNLPEVEYPSIDVTASLPGANPDVMASTVATPLESGLSVIPGLASMTSSSTTGQTNINLQFELNRNIDAAAQDVEAAITRASGDLPENMPSPPQYSKVNQTDEPILWLEMSSTTMSLDDFAQYANDVFAKRMSVMEQGRWQGPIPSSFGQHFVYISERIPGSLPALDAVRDAVRREWSNARRLEAEQKLYSSLRERYGIVVEEVPATSTQAEASR